MRSRQKLVVGREVYIPEGVEDLIYEDVDDVGEDADDASSSLSTAPPAPDQFTIVSQTLRQGPDGKLVVDVVIETGDLAGYEIDFRVTKK